MIIITSLIILTAIWVYCIFEVSTIFAGDITIECSQEDIHNDILDRQKSRR